MREVRCYRGWREDIGLQGIFLDETPTEWSKEVEEFLRGVNGIVRGALSGFGNGALVSFDGSLYLVYGVREVVRIQTRIVTRSEFQRRLD